MFLKTELLGQVGNCVVTNTHNLQTQENYEMRKILAFDGH